ncbi:MULTISPECIES: tetratricopeptide repeat protein [Asticcacaulis]|uniref:tetratricopeptide repeat protein n=1 Tax=Asticcacaulis TaxID=76890 RepID=UPI001AE3CDDF|nr:MULTISPECIES: tetratricopeptide repeat protein [Asticcacaulis]MBP2160871.1 TPR repeat protein [Asticcacaulis solisilvae]MDR6801925.1 TPR repeat protein [Asticcacaulis sp. BE141]
MKRRIAAMTCLLLAACEGQRVDTVDQALAYCNARPAGKLSETDAKDLFCKGRDGETPAELGDLRKSAEMGYAPAQVYLGYSYHHGEGVTADGREALKWYLKAAEQGSAEGQNQYGYVLFYGDGVPEAPAKAVPWFRKAAAQNYTHSQTLLAEAYYEGKGVAKDYNEAFRLYSLAADNTHSFAIFMTGMLYIRGHGVAKDEAKGARLVQRAAEMNIVDAQVELGRLYEKGIGVKADDNAALIWYEVAGMNGRDTADEVAAISARLSPEEVRQAQADAEINLTQAERNAG